ncbi:MAG TPA: hypothetical protein PLB89_02860 [Flavobacteriales bacterium]|nr:hypothetical protein [Flavobacteriales bacterium]
MRILTFFSSLGLVAMANGQSISGGVGGIGSGGGGGLGSWLAVELVNVLMSPGSFMNDEPVEHARDIETRLLGGAGFSLQVPELTGQSGSAKSRAYPWPGLRTELGASFTYRDRVMLSVNGGLGLSGYAMRLDTMAYSIYHGTRNAEARLGWHTLPQRNVPQQWSFALGYGFTFQRADDKSTDRDGFNSLTVAPQLARPYLTAELGRFTATGRDRYEICVRFVKHLPPMPAWTNTSSFNGTTVTSEASDDHLALLMRYHLGSRKDLEPLPVHDTIRVPAAMDALPTMACKRQRVTLKLWDDAEMDGDTVSVLLNGEPALVRHNLAHKPVKLRLDLHYGQNCVQVVAHNEGRIAPNTARGIIRRGKGREVLLIKTDRSKGEMLYLVRG